MAGVFPPAMFVFTRQSSLFILTLHALVSAVGLCAEHDGDIRYWQTLAFNFHENEDWRFKGLVQTRLFDDADFLGAYLFVPTVEYKLSDQVDIGATYLHQGIRGECTDAYTMLNIYWLHATSRWKINDKMGFTMRNVLAYRDYENGVYADYWLTRNRFALGYTIEEMGRLVASGISAELFYDLEEGYLSEVRTVPLSLTFRLTDQVKLTLYGMVQSKNYCTKGSDWEHAYVLGQTLSYNF